LDDVLSGRSGQALLLILPEPPPITPMSLFASSYLDAKLNNNPGKTMSPNPSMELIYVGQ
jgi:hypothetical protein